MSNLWDLEEQRGGGGVKVIIWGVIHKGGTILLPSHFVVFVPVLAVLIIVYSVGINCLINSEYKVVNALFACTIGCKPCQCNPIGTAGNKCNPTTGSCTCKSLVMGARCEKCTVGYYGFSSDFPETCLPCHCTGKTQECDAASDYYLTKVSTVFSTKFDNNDLQGWQSVDKELNPVGKLQWEWAPEYSMAR